MDVSSGTTSPPTSETSDASESPGLLPSVSGERLPSDPGDATSASATVSATPAWCHEGTSGGGPRSVLDTQGSPDVPLGQTASVPHAPRSMSRAAVSPQNADLGIPRRVCVVRTAPGHRPTRGSVPGVRALWKRSGCTFVVLWCLVRGPMAIGHGHRPEWPFSGLLQERPQQHRACEAQSQRLEPLDSASGASYKPHFHGR